MEWALTVPVATAHAELQEGIVAQCVKEWNAPLDAYYPSLYNDSAQEQCNGSEVPSKT